MYSDRLTSDSDSKSTQVLVYKGYIVLLERFETRWGWSSDFGYGCSATRQLALDSARETIDQVLKKCYQCQAI